MVRPTYAEINLGAIAHNVTAFDDLIGDSSVCAVVKADGYGHGDVPVASTALNAGASMVAVALVEEGVRLREAGIEAPVLVLSEPDPEGMRDAIRWGLEPTVYNVDSIEAIGSQAKVHVKIDTGMHRVGAPPDDLSDLLDAVAKSSFVELASVWTHFSVADEDPEFTKEQIDRFDEAVAHFDLPAQHLANTAGAALFHDARRDFCRVGLGTYGLHPTPATIGVVDLKPAMRLVSHVTHRRTLPAGARPSYGRVRELERRSNVVTVPVGYADGVGRRLTEYGCALIGGKRFRFAGNVTMDQIVIDVGDEDVGIGEEVVLLGSQDGAEISANEWAEDLGTISYEVVCSIGPRVPRRYV